MSTPLNKLCGLIVDCSHSTAPDENEGYPLIHTPKLTLGANPRCSDFYERYQRIIDEYNREQDRTTIEATLEALTKLSEELSKEEQLFVREGFTNERQLAVFDMLYENGLTKSEIEQIKQLSRKLVDKIQEQVAQMVRWAKKPETRSMARTLIRDKPYQLLPQSYQDESKVAYRDVISSNYTQGLHNPMMAPIACIHSFQHSPVML